MYKVVEHSFRPNAPASAETTPERHGFRVGEWMEVRPISEVLETLDAQGRLAGLPFMPEMAQYCGHRFKVVKSAHKTCDPTGQGNLRRMADAVHLDTRCNGSGHDGCEAKCLLYWKSAWLKRVDGPATTGLPLEADNAGLQRLRDATRYSSKGTSEIRYSCQATEIVRATTDLPSRELGQYVEDLTTRNVSVASFVWFFAIALSKSVASKLAKRWLPEGLPSSENSMTSSAATSVEILGLNPGELVQIRSAKEIVLTLNKDGKNRGLSFEKEMLRYCGGTYRVAYRISQIIDEISGKKLRLERDCIVLEGLKCAGLENRGRLFCPRSTYFYWREAWLRRVPDDGGAPDMPIVQASDLRGNAPR